MNIPPEVRLQTVLQEKEKIIKATDEILNILNEESVLDKQSEMFVIHKINKIVESLSVIAGFCDNKARNIVSNLTKVALFFTMTTEIGVIERALLKGFCTIVNSIVVDFNKTPFSFSGEFKARFNKFMASVKATYKKGANSV